MKLRLRVWLAGLALCLFPTFAQAQHFLNQCSHAPIPICADMTPTDAAKVAAANALAGIEYCVPEGYALDSHDDFAAKDADSETAENLADAIEQLASEEPLDVNDATTQPQPSVEVVTEVAAAPNEAIAEVTEAVEPAVEEVAEAVEVTEPAVEEVAEVVEAVEPAIEEVAEEVEAVEPTIEEVAEEVEAVEPAIEEVAEVVEAVEPAIEEVAEVVEAVEPAIEEVVEAVEPAIEEVVEVVEAVEPAMEKVAEVVEAVEPAVEVVAEVVEAVEPAMEEVAEVVEAVEPAIEEVAEVVEAVEPAAEEIAEVVEAVEPAIEEVAEVAEAVEPAMEEVAEVVEAVEPAIEEVAEVVEAVEPAIEEVAEVVEAVEPAAEEIAEVVEAVEPASEEVAEVVEAVEPAAEEIAEVIEAVEPSVEEVAEVAEISEPVVEVTEAQLARLMDAPIICTLRDPEEYLPYDLTATDALQWQIFADGIPRPSRGIQIPLRLDAELPSAQADEVAVSVDAPSDLDAIDCGEVEPYASAIWNDSPAAEQVAVAEAVEAEPVAVEAVAGSSIDCLLDELVWQTNDALRPDGWLRSSVQPEAIGERLLSATEFAGRQADLLLNQLAQQLPVQPALVGPPAPAAALAAAPAAAPVAAPFDAPEDFVVRDQRDTPQVCCPLEDFSNDLEFADAGHDDLESIDENLQAVLDFVRSIASPFQPRIADGGQETDTLAR